MDMWGPQTRMLVGMKDAVLKSLAYGVTLPKVAGFQIDVGDVRDGYVDITVSLVDAKGVKLFELFSHLAGSNTSYTLTDIDRAFTIQLGA